MFLSKHLRFNLSSVVYGTYQKTDSMRCKLTADEVTH